MHHRNASFSRAGWKNSLTRMLAALLVAALTTASLAQDSNIGQPVAELERLLAAEPLVIAAAQISRPKAKGDITLRAEVSFGGAAPLRVKLRRAEPGADSFNNVPRYELAAYALQKLFLDAGEYVVPPTELRMLPLAEVAKHAPGATPTFSGTDQVLNVVQYWLNDIVVVEDVYRPAQFAADPLYARHIGQLNVLSYLIGHGDSNLGNFLIGTQPAGARVFSIDHGVAFASAGSDRGELWKRLRVNLLPADTVERLRRITPQLLADRLGVLAQWKLESGRYVRVAAGPNLALKRGVRQERDMLQMGLTAAEIQQVQRLLVTLLAQVGSGKIKLAPTPAL